MRYWMAISVQSSTAWMVVRSNEDKTEADRRSGQGERCQKYVPFAGRPTTIALSKGKRSRQLDSQYSNLPFIPPLPGLSCNYYMRWV